MRRFHSLVAAAPLVLGLSLGLGAEGCKKPSADVTGDKDNAAQAAPIPVHFAKVEEKSLPRRLELSAALDADERSEIAAQASGTVIGIPIDLGTRVKKGDLLVELDSREASLRLQNANATAQQQRARLGLDGKTKFDASNTADVRSAKDALDLADTELQRSEALYKDGAIPKAQYDQAKSAREHAAANFDMAKNSVDQGYAGLGAAEAQAGLSAKTLDDTKIKAPFDGVVAEKRISAGEFAVVGKVVLVLVKDDPLRLRFDVAENDIGSVTEGAKVEIRVAAFPDKVFQGVVKRVGASLKTQSRTLPVEAEVANVDRMLKPGFFARASVALAGEPVPTLLVPKKALVAGASGSRLFVKNGDKVSERLVTVGATSGDLVEVRGQIAKDEEIAVDSVDKLADATLVTDAH